MTQRPWLSVVIPVFNGEPYLGRALESIAIQASRDIEVIVVDDGSTDRSLEIARTFIGRLNLEIRALRHTGNWVASTNHGLREARAPYASILHQDDVWLSHRAHLLRSTLNRLPQCTLLTTDAVFIGPAGNSICRWRCPLPTGAVDPVTFMRRMLIQNNLAVAAPAFQRQWLLDHGGLDESLWYTADWDLWLRIGVAGSTHHIGRPSVGFRVHLASQTSSRDIANELRRQMVAVYHRHRALPDLTETERRSTLTVAACALEFNAALAGLPRGERIDWRRFARACRQLGFAQWFHLVRYSRMLERTYARVRSRW